MGVQEWEPGTEIFKLVSNWACHQRKEAEFSTPHNQLRALKMLSKPELLNLSLTPGS